jgi:hypothetical protein
MCLVWPAIINSGPVYFFDTAGYLRGGMQAFRALFHLNTEWSLSLLGETQGSESAVGPAASASDTDGFVSAARSIYYGLFVYIGAISSSLWLVVFAQAALAAWAIYLSARLTIGTSWQTLPVILIPLGLLTPLSFFVSYLMPDVFAGVTILSVSALLAYSTMSLLMRLQFFLILVLAMVFHTSHIAIAFLMSVIGLSVAFFTRMAFRWHVLAVLGSAIALGVLSQVAFYKTVEAVFGHLPTQPPFIMARMIADGPGLQYLKQTCPENGFRVCDFLENLSDDSDNFLWSSDPDVGVYGIAGWKTREELNQEQLSFVMQVLKFDFWGQLTSSMLNFANQLSRYSLSEFAYNDLLRSEIARILPASEKVSFERSSLYLETFPLREANSVQLFIVVLSSLVALAVCGGRVLWSHHFVRDNRIAVFSIYVVAGVILNAAITGVLSMPHDRYQSRVIWLITFVAILLMAQSARLNRR